MMAITEEALKEADDKSEENNSEDDENDEESDFGGIPVEFLDLYNDEELKQTLIDLILTASDLDILDFQVTFLSDFLSDDYYLISPNLSVVPPLNN
jgi:hypothetical protein